MAVAAYDLALCDLLENALPVPVGESAANVERLVGEVVELEDDGIAFAAVGAGVGDEEVEKELRPLQVQRVLTGLRLVDVALLVLQVMLPVVCGATWAA
jgi:hypothetical protein